MWDDAARLVVNKEDRPGVERIFHNRGIMFSVLRRFPQAIADYSKAIAISPDYSYAYNDRGAAYLEIQEYRQAQDDFTKAIELNPIYYRPYIGRALAHEAQGNAEAARQDFKVSCLNGVALACRKFRTLAGGGNTH